MKLRFMDRNKAKTPSPDYLRWQEEKRAKARIKARKHREKRSDAEQYLNSVIENFPYCAHCGRYFPARVFRFVSIDPARTVPPPSKLKEYGLERVKDILSWANLTCPACRILCK
jgi:hypothetical protein